MSNNLDGNANHKILRNVVSNKDTLRDQNIKEIMQLINLDSKMS